MVNLILGTLLGIAAIALVGGVLFWLVMWQVDHRGAEPGGSWGRQLIPRRTERAYTATISVPGRPAEQITMRYSSRGEAKSSLRSMYGRRNVSNVHAEDDAP